MCNRSDAAVKIFQVNELIGSVCVFIGQSEPEKNGVQSEELFELDHNRDRSAFPLKEGFFAEPFLKRLGGGLDAGAFDRGDGGLSPMEILDVDLGALRCDFPYMVLEQPGDRI